MPVNGGFSSEDEFDTSVDFDPAFLSELDQAEQSIKPTQSKPTHPRPTQYTSPYARPTSSAASARPGQQVLRPPVPPPPKRARLASATPAPGPSQSTSAKTGKQWVHPNPFIKPETKVAEVVEDDEDDDDTPMIIMGSGGYQVEASAPPPPRVGSVAPPPRARTPSVQPAPPARAAPKVVQPPPRASAAPGGGARAGSATPVAGPSRAASGMNGAGPAAASAVDPTLARELEALRKEKEKLEKELEESRLKIAESRDIVYAKTGEITMVRRRLAKTEEDHATQRERELQAKRQLEEALKAKDAEHRREIERINVENAFKRQELETSARRPPNSSQWSAQRHAQARAASQVPAMPSASFYGPSKASPTKAAPTSAARHRALDSPAPRGGSRRTPAPPPQASQSMAGFKNSFFGEDDMSPAPPGARKARLRAGSAEQMPPPQLTSAGRRGVKREMSGVGMETPRGKGKGREMSMVDGDDEGDSVMMDDGEEMRIGEDWGAGEGEVVDELEDGLGRDEGRDWHREITAAVLSHTTITHFDSTSAVQPSPASTPRGTFGSGRTLSSMPASRFMMTAATSSAAVFPSLPSTRLPPSTAAAAALNSAPPAPPTPDGPAPTIRGLTNVRFGPATSSAVMKEYEEVCCELFVALGRRDGLDSGVAGLVEGLGQSLISLISLFEREAVIGPLIGALHLLASLVLVFPQFTACLLPRDPRGGPSALLTVLAKVVRRFGRPTPPPRQPESAAKAKARERSRRARGLVARASEAVSVAEEERVVLDGPKRVALLFGAVEVLEGLAWRMGEEQETAMAHFLKSQDAVATLLDPLQPTALLTGAVRFLTLLACRPGLFMPLVTVGFYDAGDVRASVTKVPLLARCGTLLVRPTPAGQAALDRCILSFVTILLTKHEDAITFVAQSQAFIPELLDKLFRDVRTVWESDGQASSDAVLANLGVVVRRLDAAVRLFHLLTCSPAAERGALELFAGSQYAGLIDRFAVAFGTLGFAGLPDWTEGRGEGRVLGELKWVAQECCEEVRPEELDEWAGVWEEGEEEEEGEGEGGEEEEGMEEGEEGM